MKSELKAKFIQHILNKNKNDRGFTLIELLVVIIIIGILSAIALPSFLNQANKAKQVEAKTYTGSMNRAQQGYYLENTAFSSAIGNLGLGIVTQTINYQYTINVTSGNNAIATNQASVLQATAPIKSYVGGVEATSQQGTSEVTTITLLCESQNTMSNGGTNASNAQFTYTAGVISCPANFVSLAE